MGKTKYTPPRSFDMRRYIFNKYFAKYYIKQEEVVDNSEEPVISPSSSFPQDYRELTYEDAAKLSRVVHNDYFQPPLQN